MLFRSRSEVLSVVSSQYVRVLGVRVKETKIIVHCNGGYRKKLTFPLPTYMANVGEVEEDAQQNPHDQMIQRDIGISWVRSDEKLDKLNPTKIKSDDGHVHGMGGSMIKLWDEKVREIIHRPSEGWSSCESGHVPMLSDCSESESIPRITSRRLLNDASRGHAGNPLPRKSHLGKYP